jgi:ATP-dependent Lhr-like helicase
MSWWRRGRAAEVRQPDEENKPDKPILMIAAERWPLVRAALPEGKAAPHLQLPKEIDQDVDPEQATTALVRGRLELCGPVTAVKIALDLGMKPSSVEDRARQVGSRGGRTFRVRYTSASYKPEASVEWCERRLLARIHRLTLETARRRINRYITRHLLGVCVRISPSLPR